MTMGITLARRRCAGCRKTTGFALWPWSGHLLVTSHGLCRGCLHAVMPASGVQRPTRVLTSDLLC
jgi:hypothetical protein